MKEKLSEAKWPGLMCAASLLNIFGSMVAIAVGADKTDEGKTNPFFYCALANSTLYAISNGIKVYEVCTAKKFVDIELARRAGDVEQGVQNN